MLTPSNLSTQFGYLSTIWNILLDDYPLVTAYCSVLEIAAVDVDVVCPMQMEDGCPLEPRIRRLHPIQFSQVPIPF